MVETKGDIQIDLNKDNQVVLSLLGFPYGETQVLIPLSKWDLLVKQISSKRKDQGEPDGTA